MVNQTSCTKSMFGFVHIHIVHSYPQSFPPELSTSDFVGFSGFSSYTPTYPHYPHIFTCSFLHLLYICPFFLFCIYLINLLFLTKGADCSGFVMSVFSHFGISTGRSSRDQAARGKTIPVSEVKPGDLLFYASGSYINHVGIYVGNGKIIHSSTPATGICYTPSNYRTPCKAVTFFD